MRKLLITALAGGIMTAGGVLVAAHALPSTSCANNPSGAPVGYTATASASGGTLAVCTKAGVPGSVTASGSPSTQSGYVIADGDAANNSLPGNCLDGYIGVSSADSSAPGGLVGLSSGNYSPAGGNHPLIPPSALGCH